MTNSNNSSAFKEILNRQEEILSEKDQRTKEETLSAYDDNMKKLQQYIESLEDNTPEKKEAQIYLVQLEEDFKKLEQYYAEKAKNIQNTTKQKMEGEK